MPPRNLAKELHEMGIGDDDEEWNELQAKENERQEWECRRQYLKDVEDFREWQRKNQPVKSKNHWGKPKLSGGTLSPEKTSAKPSSGPVPGATN